MRLKTYKKQPYLDIHLIIETFLQFWYIVLLFFTIAVLYSSVGFGGGSSYLAILAFTGIAFSQIRAISLLCNIIVVAGNVFLFYQQKQIVWKKTIPIVICSVPLAFLGGYIRIEQAFFFILLGGALLFAAVTMWFSKQIVLLNKKKEQSNITKNLFYGGFVGFISGMVGIGGGVFLAPLLHITNWETPRKIAATASFFILANSIAGLFGQSFNPNFEIDGHLATVLLIAVFIGGYIGSTISNRYFTALQLKKATAILIAFVSFRILWKYL